MKPLAIVSAIGSRGDVNPMLALGRELAFRGWRILFLTSEPYISLSDRAGFESHSLVSQEDFDAFITKPGLWRPVQGLRVVLGETAAELIQPTFDLLQQRFEPGNTVLVTHPLDFASRIFRDLHSQVPLVGCVLAPMAIRTHREPARLTDWPFEISRPAWLVRASYHLADRLFISRWLGKPINQFRKRLGLPPVDRVLHHWYLSPDLVLGLFPDWFAPHKAQWPEQLRCPGFPLEDAHTEMSLADSSTVQRMLDRHVRPPIVFAPGSANSQARDYFAMAAEVCDQMQIPALLLTEFDHQLPNPLPENVLHESYTPFGALLPHCRAIVHHGGIGTTSQSLAAGIPQLIVPMAFDQFDNARRVQELGCGRSLLHRRLSARRLRGELTSLLTDESMPTRCQEIQQRFKNVNAVKDSVDEIERLAAARGVRVAKAI